MRTPTHTSSDGARTAAARRVVIGRVVMVVLGAACLLPLVGEPFRTVISPPVALAAGVVVALAGLNGFAKSSGQAAKVLIQVSVVLLGLSMELHEVVRAGAVGILFAAGTIVGTFALGIVLGRALKIGPTLTTLLSAGTAICGGSAIAATGSVIGASQAQIAVATGTVFILNGIGLYVFPPLGKLLEMSQEQFGTWAAVAIHDVSSVVGAAKVFDQLTAGGVAGRALEVATAVKLTRTLWIVPVALGAAWVFGRWNLRERETGSASGSESRTTKSRTTGTTKRIPIPWFIGLFVLAAAARTFVPGVDQIAPHAKTVAVAGMTLALFLIGAGMSIAAVKAVGWRAMVLGVVLWVFISAVALVVVQGTVK